MDGAAVSATRPKKSPSKKPQDQRSSAHPYPATPAWKCFSGTAVPTEKRGDPLFFTSLMDVHIPFYILAGGMTSETYPSERMVATHFDTAGRIDQVSAGSTMYVSSFAYAPHGAVKALRLGNGWWEHANFNTRLQAEEIGFGSSSDDSSLLRLTYGYGGTSNNGNILSQEINAQGQIWSQSYGYDLVNRLQSASEPGCWRRSRRAASSALPGRGPRSGWRSQPVPACAGCDRTAP